MSVSGGCFLEHSSLMHTKYAHSHANDGMSTRLHILYKVFGDGSGHYHPWQFCWWSAPLLLNLVNKPAPMQTSSWVLRLWSSWKRHMYLSMILIDLYVCLQRISILWYGCMLQLFVWTCETCYLETIDWLRNYFGNYFYGQFWNYIEAFVCYLYESCKEPCSIRAQIM